MLVFHLVACPSWSIVFPTGFAARYVTGFTLFLTHSSFKQSYYNPGRGCMIIQDTNLTSHLQKKAILLHLTPTAFPPRPTQRTILQNPSDIKMPLQTPGNPSSDTPGGPSKETSGLGTASHYAAGYQTQAEAQDKAQFIRSHMDIPPNVSDKELAAVLRLLQDIPALDTLLVCF